MDRTVFATRDTFDSLLADDDRERFWALVQHALRLLDADLGQAADYRCALEQARPGERIAAYHASPLQIAADLAGLLAITDEALRRFLVLQGELYGSERGEASACAGPRSPEGSAP